MSPAPTPRDQRAHAGRTLPNPAARIFGKRHMHMNGKPVCGTTFPAKGRRVAAALAVAVVEANTTPRT
ncbi:hypothetical protein BSIN_2288 [Burkholderia singularis]|uniref:Uncharacterized protein n=1 Tax=Burkholderia singularis TaxID=1503053 RepID=A0A238H1B7_9BURK|nr:hypothetical protein BSIN_2288 [Burkholderia singularis]